LFEQGRYSTYSSSVQRATGLFASFCRRIDVTPPGGVGSKQFYEMPAPFRPRDAARHPVLDFGAVLLRFG
jgi:hypothetical protein